MSTYTYSIQSDFPNHAVSSDRLTSEISDSAIVTALDHIDTSGDSCHVVFKAELSSGDEQTLDGLVAAHSGEALPSSGMLVSLAGPKQVDGSPYFSPCMFPSGVYLYITGAGDGTERGNGQAFQLSSETEENKVVEFGFLDWVLVAGGGVLVKGAQLGDHATMEVYCPATPVVPNGGNTGNCNVVNGIIVPAAGNGSYDVNLAQANPVLTPLKNGYWEWDFPLTGKGTVTLGAPGQAGAHLIAADYPLTKFINKTPLRDGHMDFTISAIEPKILLPHWKGKVTVHNAGHTGLEVAWYLTTARVQTI